MNAEQKIRRALLSIYAPGDVNAARVAKEYAYNGAVQQYGWHVTPFNNQPIFLGASVAEALETIDAMADERASNQ